MLISIPYAAIRIWVPAQFNTDFSRGSVRIFCKWKTAEQNSRERGRKRPTPTRSVGHFCPSHRLFCSAVLLQQNVLTEPLKKSVLNWADTHIANYCIRITNPYRLYPVSQRYPLVFFHAFYDIFENLIEFRHFYLKWVVFLL